MVIHLQCAWCLKNLGQKEDSRADTEKQIVSHSICPACKRRHRSIAAPGA